VVPESRSDQVSAPSAPGPARFYQASGYRWAARLGSAFAFVGVGSVWIVTWSALGLGTVGLLVLLVLAGWLEWRFVRQVGLRETPSGLELQYFWRTRAVPYGDVTAFEWRPWHNDEALFVVLKEGQRFRVPGIVRPPWTQTWRVRWADGSTREIAQLLEQRCRAAGRASEDGV
jgi:hypothetical protein